MKTVTIPTCANPFVVIVNGIEYTYPAGATVEVPDDVAAVIEQHDEAHSKHAPAPVVPPFAFVPSANNVIDLTKYKFENGQSFNDVIFILFASGETEFSYAHDGSFWSDLSKTTNPVLSIDMSLMTEGHTIEVAVTMLVKSHGVLSCVTSSLETSYNSQRTNVTIEIHHRIAASGYAEDTTAIKLMMMVVSNG